MHTQKQAERNKDMKDVLLIAGDVAALFIAGVFVAYVGTGLTAIGMHIRTLAKMRRNK